jgi:hypothetical protein
MSEQTATTAVGVFEDRRHAHLAVERLAAAGFALDDIGFVMPEGEPIVEPPPMPQPTLAGEGAATGAAIGVLLGAAVTAAIPGIGPIIVGGVLTGALTGAAGGGLLGALIGQRIPEDHAKEFERHFHTGKTLVTVRAGDRYDEAAAILRAAAEVPEVTDHHPHGRRLSDNDLSSRTGSVLPGEG